MEYVTIPITKRTPVDNQKALMEFLMTGYVAPMEIPDQGMTRTYELSRLSNQYASRVNENRLIEILQDFNRRTEKLREVSRHDLYHSFQIPKKSGEWRHIDAPNPELMDALRELKRIFTQDFRAMWHTAAFAYVPHRSTVNALYRHQKNESKWFAKFDFTNFFGSVTKEFTMKTLRVIFPFSRVLEYASGEEALSTALDLAFLDGGLPQGTPISPMLTNLLMIPMDYILSNTLRNFNKQSFVYTRYADDMQISSKYDFDVRAVQELIQSTIRKLEAPMVLNESKTRYGSSSGRNWNLGLMLNKDNEITVGHQRKKRLQTALYNYCQDRKKGVQWSKKTVETLYGNIGYCRQIEKEATNRILEFVSAKQGFPVEQAILEDLKEL